MLDYVREWVWEWLRVCVCVREREEEEGMKKCTNVLTNDRDIHTHHIEI